MKALNKMCILVGTEHSGLSKKGLCKNNYVATVWSM